MKTTLSLCLSIPVEWLASVMCTGHCYNAQRTPLGQVVTVAHNNANAWCKDWPTHSLNVIQTSRKAPGLGYWACGLWKPSEVSQWWIHLWLKGHSSARPAWALSILLDVCYCNKLLINCLCSIQCVFTVGPLFLWHHGKFEDQRKTCILDACFDGISFFIS